MEVKGQLHILAAVAPGERAIGSRYIGGCMGSQSLSGRGGEEKNTIIAPAGNWIPVVHLAD